MKNASMQNFERCVLVSGLISLPAWDELWADYLASRNILRSMEGEVFPETFSHYIIERGVLNDWQIQQLLAGHTKFNLGSYQIVNSLGQGGMGQVFLAQHSVTRQEAAVKVLPRDKCAPEAIKNFWGVSFYLNIYRARACTRNNMGQNSPEHSKTIIFS